MAQVIVYSSLFNTNSTSATSAGTAGGETTTSTSYIYAGPSPTKRGEVCSFSGTCTVSSNLATAGDLIRFIQVPKGTRLLSMVHDWGDLDGGTTLVADVGWETSDPNAFLSASSIYQSADTTVLNGEDSNKLGDLESELAFDNGATTVDNDYLSITVTTGATSLAATRTINFRGAIYIP